MSCGERRHLRRHVHGQGHLPRRHAHSNPANLFNFNGTLYFQALDGTHGYELWKSDGTSSGTTLVADIYSGIGGSNPYNFANVNGTLFFAANDGTTAPSCGRRTARRPAP